MKRTIKQDGKGVDGDGPCRRAVVDIGSNSVRLVIFDGPVRAPMAICNEKALCGLGRDMTDEGTLNPASVADAIATLKRFRMVLRAYGDPQTQTFATSAVREAKDGEPFVAAIRDLGLTYRSYRAPRRRNWRPWAFSLSNRMHAALSAIWAAAALS